MALVGPGFPVLLFRQDDETAAGIERAAPPISRRAGRGCSSPAATLPGAAALIR